MKIKSLNFKNYINFNKVNFQIKHVGIRIWRLWFRWMGWIWWLWLVLDNNFNLEQNGIDSEKDKKYETCLLSNIAFVF